MKGKMFHLSVETQSGRASQRLTSGWQGHRFVPNPNERNLSLYVLSASQFTLGTPNTDLDVWLLKGRRTQMIFCNFKVSDLVNSGAEMKTQIQFVYVNTQPLELQVEISVQTT